MKIGCCGFPVRKEKYVKNFDVVELQQTFYHPPELMTAKKWREEAPSDFEFCLKAWQLITHPSTSPTYRKLRTTIPKEKANRYGNFRPSSEVMAAWEKTKEIAQTLKARIIVFQSPASFQPTTENKRSMRRFFEPLDRGSFLLGWESRGKWKPEEIQELCQELNLIDIVDPFNRLPVTEDIYYLRLHGIGGYRYRYTEDDLQKLKGWAEKVGEDVYVMFNNIYMFEDALRLKQKIK